MLFFIMYIQTPNLHAAQAAATAEPVQKAAPAASQAAAPTVKPAAPQPTTSSYRPMHRETSINIPDFLKNKR